MFFSKRRFCDGVAEPPNRVERIKELVVAADDLLKNGSEFAAADVAEAKVIGGIVGERRCL